MPAPKRANTAAAVAAAAAKARRRTQERKASELSADGWFVASPDEIAKIEAEEWGPGMIAEWYAEKVDAAQAELARHRRFTGGA